MADAYLRQQNTYGNISGSLQVSTFTGQTTLASPRGATSFEPQQQLAIQRIRIRCTAGFAGATWDVQDSNGNSLSGVVSVDPAKLPNNDPAPLDFGSRGLLLPAGVSLVFVPSVQGAKGEVTWEGFQRIPVSTPGA